MIVRTVKCTLVNDTGDTLTLDASASTPSSGAWSPAPPAQCDKQADFACQSNGSPDGARGTAKYDGPNGSVVVSFSNPLEGSNDFSAVGSGSYDAGYSGAQGRDPAVTYRVRKKSTGPGDHDGMPTAVDKDLPADDHTRQAHAPIRNGPIVISSKDWLVDIAWQAVNHLEWDSTILEITENRHGEGGGAGCPKNLRFIEGVEAGSPGHETCMRPHTGTVPDDFHSWCGDYVTWVFWKAWMIKKGTNPDEETRKLLVKFLNREALRSVDPVLQKQSETWKQDKRSPKVKGADPAKWQPEKNLTMFESFAKQGGGGLLVHHPFDPKQPDAYEPRPGDVLMCNRSAGGHIDIVAYYNPKPLGKGNHHSFITLDGKSFDEAKRKFDWGTDGKDTTDKGWLQNGMPPPPARVSKTADRTQGVAQTERQTDDTVTYDNGSTANFCSAWIDTSKLRERLGYR